MQRPGELRFKCKKRTSTLQPFWGFPGGSDRKESACNTGNQGLIPWRRDQLPTPIFLPGEFYGQRNLVGYIPWGHKELDTPE